MADSYNVKSWARGYCILMILFMIALYLVESMYYMIGSYRFRDAHVGVWHMVFIAGQWIMGTIFLVPALVVSRWYNLWDKRLYNSRRDVAEIFGSLIIIVPVLTAIQVIDLARFGIIQDLDLHSAALPVYRSTCFLGGTCSLVLLYVLFRCVPAFWRKAPQMAVYVVQND